MVLSGTPVWYAKDPNAPSAYGSGFCSPTNDLGAWRNYVTAVATRYKGVIKAYEPVNEGDILAFWCGNEDELRGMAKVAYQAIKSVDPHAFVTSPSFVDRETVNQYVIVDYMKHGGYKWADVVSYHPYGMPNYSPERNANLVKVLSDKLSALGIHKRIWSTEINYGLPMGNANPQVAMPLTPDQQAAYVVRTYLMQWDVGVRRVYWYDWSTANFLGVKMFGESSPSRAFATARWWMRGNMYPCTVNKHRTHTCRISYPGRDGYVRWNPNGPVRETLPKNVLTKRNMYGTLVPMSRTVSPFPVLYR
jgi:hypothetical protein